MFATITTLDRVASLTGPVRPPLPATAVGRQAAYADAVLLAILTLQKQLSDPDATVSHAAAVAIVDLEKTRMRHDTPVAGTHAPSEMLEPLPELEPLSRPSIFAATERNGVAGPAPGGRGEEGEDWDDEDEPDEEAVELARECLQQMADERGVGEVVSRNRAYQFARQARDRDRRQTAPAAST